MKYKYDKKLKKIVPYEEIPGHKARRSFNIFGKFKPYISVIDGTKIESRPQHRDHLRQHNCIEVGTEKKYLLRGRKNG